MFRHVLGQAGEGLVFVSRVQVKDGFGVVGLRLTIPCKYLWQIRKTDIPDFRIYNGSIHGSSI